MTFTNIDNSLLQGKTVFKSPAQKLTYIFLTSFANCEKVFPSINKIAEATCQSERSVMRIVKELEELGFIKVSRTTGKSNVYKLVPYHVVTSDKQTPVTEKALEPVTECHSTPVTKSHTKTNNLLKTKNKNNISLTREQVINELMNQFPNVPVQEIANDLESDSSAVVSTIAQFKGLLNYRVKNYKPVTKQFTGKKPVRVELIPDHMRDDFKAPEPQVKTSKSDIMKKLKLAGF